MFQGRTCQVAFAMADSTPAIEKAIRARECDVIPLKVGNGSVEDARETIAAAIDRNVDWIIADGYRFDSAFQEQIKAAGQRLLLLDDYGHAERYCADFVLNQNLGAQPDVYRQRNSESRLLLGTRYCVLRREFLKWRGWKRNIPPKAKRILVTLGGSDPSNTTERVIEALNLLEDVQVVVVVGGSNPHLESLRTASNNNGSIQLLVDASNMSDLMAEADCAITASGTTVWEIAFMGLPGLTVVLAENQRASSEQLQERGVTQNLGWYANLSPRHTADILEKLLNDATVRGEMSERGRALVDGLGSLRVWLHLNEDALNLQTAIEADSQCIWNWANQPDVRAASFSSEPIPWQSHVEWLQAKLADPNCRLWIARDKNQRPVGQVRFDVTEDKATISVSIDPTQRGQGIGTLLIWVGCRRLFRETLVKSIQAYIKPENTASVRAFEGAGFEKMPNAKVRGCEALCFQLERARAEQ
jgi:UDP-2,4-diacetamido-2,4,6-trideoxy-beta-L-altropyranose hydrolase